MAKEIPLTKNKITVVSDEDYEFLIQWKWFADKHKHTYYAARNFVNEKGQRRILRMHRVILGAKSTEAVDHKNGDGLDNRRENIRLATSQLNQANRGINGNKTSHFKGVYFCKNVSKWRAKITVNKKTIDLGVHNREEDAANAYDVMAESIFGEFALTNKNGRRASYSR